MAKLFSDTHPQIEDLQIRLWRQASPAGKLRALVQLNELGYSLALSGLRARFPNLSEAELSFKYATLSYGGQFPHVMKENSAMSNNLLTITLKVTAVLEKLGVPYFIGGSLASTVYGLVRTTQDVDLIAALKLEHVQALVDALQDEFYIDEEMIRDAIRRQASFNIFHRESFLKVDVFIPPNRPYLQAQFERARRHTIDPEAGLGAWFASPEDTVLAKLEWYRLGGEVSELQWRDILGVLKVSADSLDLDYLRRWAAELNLGEVLARALKEAKP